MSDYEFHKGVLKRVDLSKYDNDKEKYFEARCRYEFSGLTEDELQTEYKKFNERKYKRHGGWEEYWWSESELRDVIYVGDDIYEVYDTELDSDTQCIITKVDENGNGFGHDYSLKACKFWIDEELKGNHL